MKTFYIYKNSFSLGGKKLDLVLLYKKNQRVPKSALV